jgi:hypothetical protein
MATATVKVDRALLARLEQVGHSVFALFRLVVSSILLALTSKIAACGFAIH